MSSKKKRLIRRANPASLLKAGRIVLHNKNKKTDKLKFYKRF